MTGGNESWLDLGSQNERLVVPLADQDERLVDPQIARQAGLPVAPRPLIPRSRPAADDEPDGQAAGSGRREVPAIQASPASAAGAGCGGCAGDGRSRPPRRWFPWPRRRWRPAA